MQTKETMEEKTEKYKVLINKRTLMEDIDDILSNLWYYMEQLNRDGEVEKVRDLFESQALLTKVKLSLKP